MTKKWSDLSAEVLEPELIMAQQQLAYVQGYILALRDVLKDIEEWGSGDEDEMEYYRALDNVRFSVNESLREANETLEALK